jgi:two-component system sensor histidine kinase MprB
VIAAARAELHKITSRVSLALRVALLTTAAVGLTLASVSAATYFTVRAEFESSLDESMLRRAQAAVDSGYNAALINSEAAQALAYLGILPFYVEGGRLFTSNPNTTAEFSKLNGIGELEVSMGQRDHSKRTVHIEGVPHRVVAVNAGSGRALVLAQSMESNQRALERLQLILWVVSTAGVMLAGVAGWAVASNGLRPVRRLTEATEHVARTSDLTPIEVQGRDELARLTNSFNVMLQALDASQTRQRQLVADAGHELRTPLTSLRTNIELLTQAANSDQRSLSEEQRSEIMADVRAQLEELTTLVGDLVELARDEPLSRTPEPLDFAEVVTHAAERVARRAQDSRIDVEVEPWMVVGESHLLERAVTNLLDNAVKWSPAGGLILVRLRGGELTVADQGPGIAAEDLPHIFDRFYRASEARTLPGSGLGLSIVKRAAERHGGDVTVDSRPGVGTQFTLTLPGTAGAGDDREDDLVL